MTNRKQRLRTLENKIRKQAESIQKTGIEIGRELVEIRDDELWKEGGYESWNQYLKSQGAELLGGKSFAQSTNLIRAAEIEKRLPENSVQSIGLNATHLKELGRLAPIKTVDDGAGREKDYSKLRKQDVARVLKAAGPEPSVRDIRAAVDADLGIDRAAQAKATKEERKREELERLPTLESLLFRKTRELEELLEELQSLPGEVWEDAEESDPGLAERFATVCENLASFMRS